MTDRPDLSSLPSYQGAEALAVLRAQTRVMLQSSAGLGVAV